MATTDFVAVVLAVGVTVSIIILITGVMWGAIKNGSHAASLTENETQVLLATFSGIFGILGAHVGYKMGDRDRRDRYPETPEPEPPADIEDTKERWPTQ